MDQPFATSHAFDPQPHLLRPELVHGIHIWYLLPDVCHLQWYILSHTQACPVSHEKLLQSFSPIPTDSGSEPPVLPTSASALGLSLLLCLAYGSRIGYMPTIELKTTALENLRCESLP